MVCMSRFCLSACLQATASMVSCSLHPLLFLRQSFCSSDKMLCSCMCLYIDSLRHDVMILYTFWRQVMGLYLAGLVVSDRSFGNIYVVPCVMYCGIVSGDWMNALICLRSNVCVHVSFLYQKL